MITLFEFFFPLIPEELPSDHKNVWTATRRQPQLEISMHQQFPEVTTLDMQAVWPLELGERTIHIPLFQMLKVNPKRKTETVLT